MGRGPSLSGVSTASIGCSSPLGRATLSRGGRRPPAPLAANGARIDCSRRRRPSRRTPTTPAGAASVDSKPWRRPATDATRRRRRTPAATTRAPVAAVPSRN